jgi:dephospho-CoA kinase
MIIIGITGTLGAGKGTVVEYLKQKGFAHFSVRDFLSAELNSQGLPITRDNLIKVGNQLRSDHSSGYIAEELYKKAQTSGRDCIIESIRTEGEITALRQKESFYLVSIDAFPEERYKRIVNRKSETDTVSFEEFLKHEDLEMNSSDPNNQNLSFCMGAADYRLRNDGNLTDLQKAIDDMLRKMHLFH